MFVGRKQELEKLENMYRSDQFEFAVLYGRRRVGKTTLINEFCKNKKTIFFAATESTEKENLAQLSRCVLRGVTGSEGEFSFSSFEELFRYMDGIAGERIVLVIDEYPYLAGSYPPVSSLLQAHIDHVWKDSRLFLILCGSSMSFMENQVLGYQSPIYGRRTAQLKIRPFSYYESRQMLPAFTAEEQAVLYGVTGGIPEYLSRIQNGLSLDENLIQLFFETSGRLHEEPTNLLKQELRDPVSYNSVISAIAQGSSKLNEIATKAGLETSAASALLRGLMTLGLVKKEVPVMEPPTSRRTIYLLEDQMFRFWYRFVAPNISNIVWGLGRDVYQTLVKPQLNDYMGLVFEDICRQSFYQPEFRKTLPFFCQTLGRWWGTDPRKRQQAEIDILACDESHMLLGECKWNENPVSLSVLQLLLERGGLFSGKTMYYILFAKNGATKEAVEYAARNVSCRIVTFAELNELD